ncbi:hypothetical protein ACLI4Z_18495 [Natrialbaceae archaeon A-arb3/5]
MPALERQFDAVREIGEIVIALMEIGTTPASFDCPRGDDGRLILEEDEEYWQNLKEFEGVLQEYGDPRITVSEYGEEDDPFASGRVITVNRAFDGDLIWQIEVIYHAYGGVNITARIIVDDVEKVVLKPYLDPGEEGTYEMKPVDIGRMVARAELVLLAKHLGSSAEILDYWMTDELSPALRLTQEEWGSIRGVSRQAVNENVNTAKSKLQEN